MFKDVPTFTSFSVNDLPKAKEFYADVLGIGHLQAHGLLQLKLAGGGQIIVYPKTDHEPATYTILNFQVSDIEEAVAHLKDHGTPFESYDKPGMKTDANNILDDPQMKAKIAWFKDPAGNILSVIEGEMK